MGWNKDKIDKHIEAARRLNLIKDRTFQYIKENKNCTEYEVQQFIYKLFRKYKLITRTFKLIVAFREDTSFVHYYPKKKSKKLEPGSLILIDIWGRLKNKYSPFADITWMGYYGQKVPKEIQNIFSVVLRARNSAIKYIEDNLKRGIIPYTRNIDKISRNIIKNSGFGKNFLHTTGHSLGFKSPHGGKRIGPKSKDKLIKNLAYTIEPGIIYKG